MRKLFYISISFILFSCFEKTENKVKEKAIPLNGKWEITNYSGNLATDYLGTKIEIIDSSFIKIQKENYIDSGYIQFSDSIVSYKLSQQVDTFTVNFTKVKDQLTIEDMVFSFKK